MTDRKRRAQSYSNYDETDDGSLTDTGATTSDYTRSDFDELETSETGEGALESVPLTDDPVRMYLKEIGQVPLLNNNREMWLSAQIAAEHQLEALRDELMSLDNPQLGKKDPNHLDVERFAYKKLHDNWQQLGGAVAGFKLDVPDFLKVLYEVQSVTSNWNTEDESYIRQFLSQRHWGKDDDWTTVARLFSRSFTRFSCSRLSTRCRCACTSIVNINCQVSPNSTVGSKTR